LPACDFSGLEERFFGLAEHGAKCPAKPKYAGLLFSTGAE
jgi:hypothetical protein